MTNSSGKTWADVVKTPQPSASVPETSLAVVEKEWVEGSYDEDCGEHCYQVHYERLGWKKRGVRIADVSKRFADDHEYCQYAEFMADVHKAHYDRIIPAYVELLQRVWGKEEFLKARAADNDSNEFWREMDFGEEWSYEEHLEKIAEYGLKELWDQYKLLDKCLRRFMRNCYNEDCYRDASIIKTDGKANKHVFEAMGLLKNEFLRLTNYKCSHCCKPVQFADANHNAMCGTCGFVVCDDCINYESDRMGRNCVFCAGSV